MQLNRLCDYLKTRPWHWWLAILVTLVAGFLRFYRIPETVMFLGDQGRDALLVARMFREYNPVFIGPVTSVGNMYLGPFYYYFMLPFLWLSYPSPLGPAYAVAFFSTITIFLTYLLGKKIFSPITGLLASFFLAFSAEAIDISRFSWNPNLAPLFSLLMIYFSWKAFKKPRNWIVVALLFGMIIQLHYLALLTGATVGLLWLYYLIVEFKKKTKINKKEFLQNNLKICAISLFVFLLTLVPQILFDLKHKGLISNAFLKIFSQEQIFTDKKAGSLYETITRFGQNFSSRANHILVRVPLGRLMANHEAILLLSVFLLLFFNLYWTRSKKQYRMFLANLIVLIFLLIGILGTAVYQHDLYNHYIAYLYPVTAFVYALALGRLLKINKRLFTPVVVLFIVWFFISNAQRWPLKPNYLYQRTQHTAEQIYNYLADGERYDIVLLSETNDLYGQSYRWFLSTTDRPPIVKEKQQSPETLVIIDEEKKVEDVTALDIYEIVVFPEKNIDLTLNNQDLPNIYFLRSAQ